MARVRYPQPANASASQRCTNLWAGVAFLEVHDENRDNHGTPDRCLWGNKSILHLVSLEPEEGRANSLL
jgi:hypothetical protein